MGRATSGHTYLWELPGWPDFFWDASRLAGPLDAARRSQGELLGMARAIGGLAANEAALEAMAKEVVSNSAIEGVTLDLDSVRASMMLRLGMDAGLAQASGGLARVDPIVGVLTEATEHWRDPLDLARIFAWQRALFPKGIPHGWEVFPAGQLRGGNPMGVASRPRGAKLEEPDIVHFEAPGREGLEGEIERFLAWFEGPSRHLNGLIRAGIAHLWFVTLHPLADGNGRIGRTLTDLALAQDEGIPRRFYSLSVEILRNKEAYYDALEAAQRGTLDLTGWLVWFLEQVRLATRRGIQEVGLVLARGAYWAEVRRHHLDARQERVLRSILSPVSLAPVVSNRRYRAITGVSRATAARDLAQLCGMGLLVPYGEARAASYRVDLDRFLPAPFRDDAQPPSPS